MSDTVIHVENLAKKYIIGHQRESKKYTTIRDMLMNGISSWFGSQKSTGQDTSEAFWALKNVSFEVKQGDRIGIIGRNGAGKSTLLKILSRITEPTAGQIKIKGRVASLLEVGTGFHPELTGRENIFLNGAVLGMSTAEIRRKFDEIVAFAGVEKFLDTPVKRYSSGMNVRLAFAVAAHLEPEILVVDEVLAVGDAAFQKKCLGKMDEVSKEGRTILFVSHDMATVTTLCKRVIWLVDGQIYIQGDGDSTISQYLTYNAESSGDIYLSQEKSDAIFRFKRVTLLNPKSQITSVFDIRKSIRIRLEYELDKLIDNLEISLRISNSSGVPIFTTDRSSSLSPIVEIGNHGLEIEIQPLLLAPNNYNVTIAAHIPHVEILAIHEGLMVFEVEDTGSNMSKYRNSNYGVVLIDCNWKEVAG